MSAEQREADPLLSRESTVIDEAAAALDRAGRLLSAHLASAERVTV